MDLLGKARHILRLCNAGLDQLRIAGNTGQRGLQLMADIGSKLLPHLFIVLTEDAVRVDAFGKGDKLLIGNIVLNMIQIFGHAQHRGDQCTGEQSCQHSGGQHKCNAAQHDGRQGRIINRPDRFCILCHAQNLTVGQQYGIVIGLVAHGLGVADVPAHTFGHGLTDLRAGEMVLHGLIGSRFKQHAAVLRDQGDAQIIGNKGRKLLRVLHQIITGAYQIGFPLKAGPCLSRECLVKNKDAKRRREQQTKEAHQEQAVADLFFHAAQLHSSPASSSSVSL